MAPNIRNRLRVCILQRDGKLTPPPPIAQISCSTVAQLVRSCSNLFQHNFYSASRTCQTFFPDDDGVNDLSLSLSLSRDSTFLKRVLRSYYPFHKDSHGYIYTKHRKKKFWALEYLLGVFILASVLST